MSTLNLRSTAYLEYVDAVEFIAYLNQEEVTASLIRSAYLDLGLRVLDCKLQDDNKTSFACTDGEEVLPYATKTLARHFTYIADYTEAYPDQPIRLPFSRERVRQSFESFMCTADRQVLLVEDIELLQILNPVTDRFYLTSQLKGMNPSVVESIVMTLTEADRVELLRLHQARQVTNREVCLPLPKGGLGLAILATTIDGQRYLATLPGSTLLPDCPSYLFCNAASHSAWAWELPSQLMKEGFGDNTELLSFEQKSLVLRCLMKFAFGADDEDLKSLEMMLSGDELDKAPYHLKVDLRSIRPGIVLSQALRSHLYLTEDELEQLLTE